LGGDGNARIIYSEKFVVTLPVIRRMQKSI
jgi:hypothetical protein